MKKAKALIALTAMAALLAGCGWSNKQIFDFDQRFDKVHVFATGHCYNIESWTDYEDGDQIQVKVEGKGTCLFHSSQIVLVADKCPFCDR